MAVEDDLKNGIELEIDKKVDEFDLSWLPLHRTINMVQEKEEEDQLKETLEKLEKRVKELVSRLKESKDGSRIHK